MYAKVIGNDLCTLVVIDGEPCLDNEYPNIPNIPPREVTSMEIIKYATNFSKLFRKVFPEADPSSVPVSGNVIAIYTIAGKGLYGLKEPIGVVKTTVPVYSAQREFYAPKYAHLQPSDWIKPDLRALVHWDPIIRVDSLGKAATTFYNADNAGAMEVVVEAISENGEIGYREFFYDVKKKR